MRGAHENGHVDKVPRGVRGLHGGLLDDELLGLLMQRAAKRDATEAPIVDALQKFGCVVVRLSQPGVPDLLVRTPDGGAHVVEVKAPRGSLTPAQLKFIRVWGPVPLLRTSEEAVRWLCGMSKRS